MKPLISWSDFQKLDIRSGTILQVEENHSANKRAYVLYIDFGEELGVKKTSAQITELYEPIDLIGLQVMAVVNFIPKQIGKMMSECLICGFYTKDGVVLATPNQSIENGSILG